MQWFQLRPTFEIPLAESRESTMNKLSSECAKVGDHKSFFMHGEYGELHLPVECHRLWSPHLSFYVSSRNDHGLIHGRFAPRIDVWTFVWINYLAMSFTAFFGFALAYSQWMLGEPMWGAWVAALAMVAIGVLYMVAHIGQQWSADQMQDLRNRLEGLLQSAGVSRTQAEPTHPTNNVVA